MTKAQLDNGDFVHLFELAICERCNESVVRSGGEAISFGGSVLSDVEVEISATYDLTDDEVQ